MYYRSIELETLSDDMMNLMFSLSGFSRGLLSLMRGIRRTESMGLMRY